jgi:hypothetical protein
MVKLAFWIHGRVKLPHGFKGVRHDVPRLIEVQDEQSGPITTNPIGMMHRSM